MPAGDGAVRRVTDPTCNWCGEPTHADAFPVQVDEWCAFGCHTCADAGKINAPESCIVYTFPRKDNGGGD